VAARLLARAPLTEAALTARLVALGYQPSTADATVARCRELGYVDDAVFAAERARALRARGAGSLRLAADLAARGLPEELVARAVEESREGRPEVEWARLALTRRQGRGGGGRGRAWRFLAARGFAESVVGDLLGEPAADDV
jgi:regulatory protein